MTKFSILDTTQRNGPAGLLTADPRHSFRRQSQKAKVRDYSTMTIDEGALYRARSVVSRRSFTSTRQNGAGGTPERSLTGRTISHYRILEKLGHGGMGITYRAQDVRLGRHVAVKFASKRFQKNSDIFECLRREAKVGSAVNHPNVCAVYDVGGFAGLPFVVMELLEGRTLRQLMGMNLCLETFLDVGIQVCEGLNAIHASGIVHRDIKPSNIFITTAGQTKIFDFGLAMMQNSTPPEEGRSDQRTTDSWSDSARILGTPAYMSPEQVLGEKLDGRSDLFSFGVVLYEMLTAARPFMGVSTPSVLDAVLRRPFAPILEIKPGLPAGAARLIEKSLEKDRELRYQCAADMCTDMKRLQRDLEHRRLGRRLPASKAGLQGLCAVGLESG